MTNSQFSYAQYQNVVAQAQANANGDGTKVGYFKLANDGDIAIARINLASTEEFSFAAVHTIGINGKWMKVSCLNPLGINAGGCALCTAHANNPKGSISKAAKKMFIPMLVSYRDPNSATGYTAPIPVIWDRPAAFSRELANKLMIAGDLRNTLVLITRNGKAGDMQTTYSMDILPAEHPVFKPDMIPADFSAFNNFNIARHSYWEKTVEEINAFLTTGQFPERAQTNSQTANTVANVANNVAAAAYTAPQNGGYVAPTTTAANVPGTPTIATPPFNPANTAPTVGADNNTAIPAANGAPARNFTGFSF
jgi:hypothetical protein